MTGKRIMLQDRTVVRSELDDHVLFKIFRAYYQEPILVQQTLYDHHHSELELSVIQSGSGCYRCAGKDYEFHAGDVFMHCGNDVHCFKRIDKGTVLSLLVIQFEPRFVWSSGEIGLIRAIFRFFLEAKKTKSVVISQGKTQSRRRYTIYYRIVFWNVSNMSRPMTCLSRRTC